MPAKIGFSSHCFPKTMELERILDFCETYGFGAMELNTNGMNFDPQNVSVSLLERIKGLSVSGKVRFSLHPEGMNISAGQEVLRTSAIEKLEKAIRLAASLGIRMVPIHPGTVDGDGTPQCAQEAWRLTVSVIKRCALLGRELGVRVSVENLCHVKGTIAPDIHRFSQLCKEIGLDLIGVTLDTGHAHLVDGLLPTLAVIGPYVEHMHMDDNSGRKSDHLELGKGTIDFFAMAGFLRSYEGTLNIELKGCGEDSVGPVLRSREYILRLLEGDK